jgi:hypothetical protein
MHASARHDADTPVLEALGTCMQVLTTTPTPLSSLQVRRLLDALGTVDLWSAHCTDPRDARYVRNEAIRAGYGRGKGRAAVNSQLVELLRMLLVRLGRTLLAKVPAAERATSPVTRRVGTLVKEVELMGLRERHGPRHPSTLSAINYLATLHKENGDLILAEALYVPARRWPLMSTDERRWPLMSTDEPRWPLMSTDERW